MIYQDEIEQIKVLNSSGKHLFIALCLHTKVKIIEKEDAKFRVRSCFPSHDYMAKLTGCSKSYVSKGIQNLKQHGFLETQQRAGTSAVYKITTSYTVYKEELHTVYKEELHTARKEELHTVYKEELHTVYEHIKNKDQKLEQTCISILITEKQKEILEKCCKYFGWVHKDYLEELEKELPKSCEEYLTDELILIAAYNLKRKAEKKGFWTGNYFVKGIIRWIDNGKGKSKPNIHLQHYVEKVHTDILKSKIEEPKKEEETEQVTEQVTDQEAYNDFLWFLKYYIEKYQNLKSADNRKQLENLLNHKYCNQQHKETIINIIQEN